MYILLFPQNIYIPLFSQNWCFWLTLRFWLHVFCSWSTCASCFARTCTRRSCVVQKHLEQSTWLLRLPVTISCRRIEGAVCFVTMFSSHLRPCTVTGVGLRLPFCRQATGRRRHYLILIVPFAMRISQTRKLYRTAPNNASSLYI